MEIDEVRKELRSDPERGIVGVQKFRQYLLGRKFKLYTDHKPLLSIFHPQKGIPEVVASTLQRWAITLSTYDYEVQYKPSAQHGNADTLSRLPLEGNDEYECEEEEEIVCAVEEQQIENLPSYLKFSTTRYMDGQVLQVQYLRIYSSIFTNGHS